jgi:ribonucleoside-diphosphate reductase beta chain
MSATARPLRSPQELYLQWEHDHWASQDIALAADRQQWLGLDELRRGLLYFVLSSLMVAEERISTQFCGLIYAQDDEEEGSYLSTQLVDEVRHMQFYARYQDGVVAEPAAIGRHVARARGMLGEPFRIIFDEALVSAHERLIANPRDRAAKVDFVTIYHMCLEGTLGMTTSHFVLDYLARENLLPGFQEGYGRIAADERRHVAYGTEFLRRAIAEDAAMGDVVRDRLHNLLPAMAGTLKPPGDGALDVLGIEDGELARYGLDALNRRLTLVGITL